MKLGIVGAGMIVNGFLPEILETPGVEVLGIYARRLPAAQALAETHGIPLATSDYSVLCGCGIDTVYVAVSNIAHYALCAEALEMGLNVIVEKPITAHVSQAKALRDLAKEKGCFLFEAITTLHMGTYHQVEKWLPRIGTVRNAECIFTQRSSRLDAFLAGGSFPAFQREQAGGCLMDLNVYNLHYIMGLFGMPQSAVYYPNFMGDIDTSGRMVLTYPGFTAHCCAAKDCGGNHGCIIQGTQGYIKTLLPPNQVGEAVLCLQDGTVEHFDDGDGIRRAQIEFRVFAQAIHRGDHTFCDALLEKSIAVAQVMTQARIAAGLHFPCDGNHQPN